MTSTDPWRISIEPTRATFRWARALGVSALVTVLGLADASPASAALSVTSEERIFVDVSRTTPANGACPAEPSRTLRTRLWVPGGLCGGDDPCPPYPLLVMAHGFGGLPEKFDAFATTVAAAGFVVAAPAFPLTNQNTPCGHAGGFPDTSQQPNDLTFVYGELLAANANGLDSLFGTIDPSALTLLGHSLGGVTSEGLVHTDCCTTTAPSIVATILVSDPFGVTGFFGWTRVLTGPPTLILHGQADPIVGFSFAFDLSDSLPPPRTIVGIAGAGHSDLLESQTEPPITARAVAQAVTIAFLNSQVRGETGPLNATLADVHNDGHLIALDSVVAPALDGRGVWMLVGALWLAATLVGRKRLRARTAVQRTGRYRGSRDSS